MFSVFVLYQGQQIVECVCEDGWPKGAAPKEKVTEQRAKEPARKESVEIEMDQGEDKADDNGCDVAVDACPAKAGEECATEDYLFGYGCQDRDKQDAFGPSQEP